jgi:hypothetical protein
MTPGTLQLSDVARHIVQPDGLVSTGWPAVRNTCERLGLGFDPWQDGAGRLILAKRADGLYAADSVVVSIPRQVGKTYLIGSICFALCLIEPGLTVLWTAHRFKTARETFGSMKSMAGRKSIAPRVDRVVSGAGDESIVFRNGSRVLFGARERGFGRGFARVGVLVMDECQILTDNAMDDMVPATNTAPNPLIILTGTPPKPSDPGEIFSMLRQEALDGESSEVLYLEFSADRDADPMDRSQWRKANPSYPRRTPERAMLRMRKTMGPTSWIREGLGVWDDLATHRALVSPKRWAELVDVGPADGVRPDGMAVDMSHAREVSVSACWLEGESAHVEEVWAGADVDAAVAWVAARAGQSGRRIPVVIDASSPAASLVTALRAQRVRVTVSSASDMARACGMWLDGVSAGALTHADQESVNAALATARKRAIGTAGGWGWDRKDDTVNLAPLVSHTLARYAAPVHGSIEPRRVVVL